MGKFDGLKDILKKHGITNSKLPVLPFDGIGNSARGKGRQLSTQFHPCQLDECSKKQGGCDHCPDLIECLRNYDILC